jgi:hypothetical protein
MTVLYRGKSFTITPWTLKAKPAELTKHFEALGSKVTIDSANWRITISLCALHIIDFDTHHTTDSQINFLIFAITVPGCHDAYGGLLGQTYQCKYATEKFEWTREQEAAFRVPTLETPSGSYSPKTNCEGEHAYEGNAIRGGSIGHSGDSDDATMLRLGAKHSGHKRHADSFRAIKLVPRREKQAK